MTEKSSYEQLEQRVEKVEKEALERKRTDAAMGETEAKLRLMLKTVPSGLFTVDINKRITSWNEGAARITGLTARGVVGKYCTDVLHCDGCRDECVLFDEKVDKPICGTECLLHVGGREIAISKNVDVLKNLEGVTIGGLECFVDITKRKRAEEALEEREGRLRAVLDSVQAGILTIDAQTHKIVDVNPVAAKMIGLAAERIVGQICHHFVCPAAEGKCPITDLGQTMDNSERVLVRANGETVPILKTVTSVNMDGREYLIESFLDIGDRKRAEEEQEKLVKQLRKALADVKTLSGLLPICASCKKIRDDKGYWNQLEVYIRDHSGVEFSHGLCPECAKKFMQGLR
ncbi:MAG: PAS domain-containing protein [Thermodesulfobacteriota bacterium]|nr:PAS domain-containing protein [Thermodesulfobacteriota bacterium]